MPRPWSVRSVSSVAFAWRFTNVARFRALARVRGGLVRRERRPWSKNAFPNRAEPCGLRAPRARSPDPSSGAAGTDRALPRDPGPGPHAESTRGPRGGALRRGASRGKPASGSGSQGSGFGARARHPRGKAWSCEVGQGRGAVRLAATLRGPRGERRPAPVGRSAMFDVFTRLPRDKVLAEGGGKGLGRFYPAGLDSSRMPVA